MAAMAHVKLPSSEVVKLTRESGSPLALAMGRCQRLPQMNGVQLFDQLHALPELEDVPALILTACLEDCEAEIETRKLIALRKPFDMDEFLLTIEEMLEKPTGSSSRQTVLVP